MKNKKENFFLAPFQKYKLINKIKKLLPGYHIQIKNKTWLVYNNNNSWGLTYLDKNPTDLQIQQAVQRAKDSIAGKESKLLTDFAEKSKPFFLAIAETFGNQLKRGDYDL